jgi:hypothetical protein
MAAPANVDIKNLQGKWVIVGSINSLLRLKTTSGAVWTHSSAQEKPLITLY